MQKTINKAKAGAVANAKATFSRQALGRRALSVAMVIFGFWQTVGAITQTTGWSEFSSIILKPMPLIGVGIAVVGSLLTSAPKK